MSRILMLIHFFEKIKHFFCELFTLLTHVAARLAEEEGIQPSVALTSARQFSGLVTLATRPLLRAQVTLRKIWSVAAESNRARRGCSSAARHLLLRRLAPQG